MAAFSAKKRAKLLQISDIHKFFSKKMQFFLRMSGKSSNFAPAFEKKARKCGEVAILVILLQPPLFNRQLTAEC